MSRGPFDFDPGPTLYRPGEFRRELGVSVRTFAYYRKLGLVPEPTERRRRGYKGECCYWSADQVARTKARLLATRIESRASAVDRLGHGRTHRLELLDLGRLAYDLVRAGPIGLRLRAIGCDVPLQKVPRGYRAAARAEIARALAALGART
jgi:hypothetical protein